MEKVVEAVETVESYAVDKVVLAVETVDCFGRLVDPVTVALVHLVPKLEPLRMLRLSV